MGAVCHLEVNLESRQGVTNLVIWRKFALGQEIGFGAREEKDEDNGQPRDSGTIDCF